MGASLGLVLGPVTFALCPSRSRPAQLICRTRFLPRDRYVEVQIADTGPGISEEDRRHLFEPFFTTRPEGTGLGLALCREILTSHGGRIDLAEERTTGTTFCVLLPALQ